MTKENLELFQAFYRLAKVTHDKQLQRELVVQMQMLEREKKGNWNV